MYTGGGDWPEDVAGGLAKASTMNWKAPLTRILVHIADAPGHGDFVTTNSLARREAQGLLEKLKCESNIFAYIFMKTNDNMHLKNMIDAFRVSGFSETVRKHPRLLVCKCCALDTL